MNLHKDQQQQQTMAQKLNNGHQQNRKVPHFKRNKRRRRGIQTKTIPNKTRHPSKEQQAILQFLEEDQALSMSEQSLPKTTKYDHLFDHGSNTDPTLFLSDYSLISNMAFKEILFRETTTTAVATTAADNIDIHSFLKSLNNEETWTFTRQLMHLINQLNYLKLQEEQWAHYYHLGMTDGIWTGRVSKRMARANSMSYTYGRSKHIIEQRRKKFQQQLKQIKSDINEHMTQTPFPAIDSNIIKTIATHLVDKDQYPLHVEFERRRRMLQLDAKDHQYIQAFYDLKPRQPQIRSAKLIWKMTHDEQRLRYEITMFKTWLHFKSSESSYCYNFSALQLIKIHHIISKLISDHKQPVRSFQLSIQEYNTTTNNTSPNTLIEQTLSIAEKRADSYAKNAQNTKNKLFENTDHMQTGPCIHKIITAIANSQANIIEKAQCHLQYKLEILIRH